MTAPNPSTLTCPACGSTSTMLCADGNGLCFECRNEWNPAEVVAIPRPAPAPPALTADDVLGPPNREAALTAARAADLEMVDAVTELAAQINHDADLMLADLLGGTATLEGGQTALVLAFPDDDNVRVQLATGEVVDVAFGDVERIMPATTAAAALTADLDDDVARAIADADISLAGLILKAGVATVRGAGADASVGTPPEGYLPSDPDMFPIVERAAATAVAFLIATCELDPLAIVNAVNTWEEHTNKGDQTEGEA